MEMMVHSSMTVRSKHYGKILKTEVHEKGHVPLQEGETLM